MNTEQGEKQLLSIIFETSKLNENLSKKYLSKTDKLFESIFFGDEKVVPENLTIKHCRDNKCFLFESVKNYLLSLKQNIDIESIRILNENFTLESKEELSDFDMIKSFVSDLDKEINNMRSFNGIENLQVLSPNIRKAKLFAKTPLMINGFDIQNIINPNSIISKDVLERYNIQLLNDTILVIFNNSNKELYFVVQKYNNFDVVFYSVENNSLGLMSEKDFYMEYGTNKDMFYSKLNSIKEITEKNITTIFNEFIGNYIFVIYENYQKFDYKFTDNLYGDLKYNEKLKTVAQQNSAFIKK